MRLIIGFVLALLVGVAHAQDGKRPLIDTHIHYSEDAWSLTPPAQAVQILRQAGLEKAFVSSSSDDGTQMLLKEAPDLIVPVLRPYRKRAEISTWVRDESVIGHVESRLARNTYAGIGEFHVFGADADLPVMRRMTALAAQYGLFLHAHSDSDAVNRIFAQDPKARVLWAHSGFADPTTIRGMLERYQNLWCDLAFRNEHASGGQVPPEWRKLFTDFPDRFMVGTDTFTPERWHYIFEHAEFSRKFLADLPPALAEKIGRGNAKAMLGKVAQ